jgi:hypothetical protein
VGIDNELNKGAGQRDIIRVPSVGQHLGTSFDGLELRGYDHSSHIRSPSGLWLQTGQG